MENNNKEYMLIKIIPYVRFKEGVEVDNLSVEEINNMSCEPIMLWQHEGDIYYPAELPLSVRGFGTGVNSYNAFLYDELTEEEQIKYADRVMIIKSLTDKAVKVYGEESKRFFGKLRKRVNKKS